MKKNFNHKTIIIVTIIGLIWVTFNQSGLVKLYTLKKKQSQLLKDIESLQKEEKNINQHIKKLNDDLDYIEYLAYSKFKMVKPGEKIYKIKDFKDINQ